jgi:eukaryotic-like serine/threonine-protein kinase
MSVVWRAADEVLGRTVAVKVLNSVQASGAAPRAIVLAEAQATARVAHPNVASVFDYGESVSPDGTTVPYVVMELLAGTSLAQRLASGPLEPPAALWVATEVAAGLAAAHHVGLVHRDVKPGNVILSPAGTKVVDFGIAAIAGEPDGLDADGRVVGTRLYLPPERLRRGVAVPASDMYSWGVLLHCMLTGRPPWPDDATLLQRAEHLRRAGPLPGVPAEVDGVFRRCLEPDPSARPTAREAALVVGAAAGIPFALEDVPGESLVAVAANDPTVHLRPRTAVQLGPVAPAFSAAVKAMADTMTVMGPVAPKAHWRRARAVAGVAVVAAITAVVLAVTFTRNDQGTFEGGRLEPGHASVAPTHPDTNGPTSGAPARVTLTSAGGRVVASCDRGIVHVHQASPGPGFELHNGIPGPGADVEVRFRNDSTDVRMIIRCADGAPVYSLKD